MNKRPKEDRSWCNLIITEHESDKDYSWLEEAIIEASYPMETLSVHCVGMSRQHIITKDEMEDVCNGKAKITRTGLKYGTVKVNRPVGDGRTGV